MGCCKHAIIVCEMFLEKQTEGSLGGALPLVPRIVVFWWQQLSVGLDVDMVLTANMWSGYVCVTPAAAAFNALLRYLKVLFVCLIHRACSGMHACIPNADTYMTLCCPPCAVSRLQYRTVTCRRVIDVVLLLCMPAVA